MKIFHTADWHLGKLVQGVHMTDDQAYVLDAFLNEVKREKPDCIIIAGDIYDRAVPPTEAINLLNESLNQIIIELNIPVLAISGNHDSPSRLDFGSGLMKENGLYLVGSLQKELEPVILSDDSGEVHFYLVPYADPSRVAYLFEDESIKTHDQAMKRIVDEIKTKIDPNVRNVFVGHAFVTAYGEAEENTSESERPLAIGGAEHVNAAHFDCFDYTALGHLHRSHFVRNESIRYSGSLLKYSLSEENHKKGFLMIDLKSQEDLVVEKKLLHPKRDLYRVEGKLKDILKHEVNDDYVFIHLLDDLPVLSPMEKVRSIYPNALHLTRVTKYELLDQKETKKIKDELNPLEKYELFYEEVKGRKLAEEERKLIEEVMLEVLHESEEVKQ